MKFRDPDTFCKVIWWMTGASLSTEIKPTTGAFTSFLKVGGGQRPAAGLAFLLSIHLSRRWCKWQSLLLDGPVQHIDDYRALNLVELLAAIRRSGRQIIVAVENRVGTHELTGISGVFWQGLASSRTTDKR